jgi:integrase
MPRAIHRLTALQVRDLLETTKRARYADGGGLYLQIDDSGGKSWIFVWRKSGRRRITGLGSARTVTLKEARTAAAEQAALVRQGKDPIDERKKRNAKAMTFGEASEQCFTNIEKGWRSRGHRVLWQRSLSTHAKPLLTKPVNQITVGDIDRVLRPLWITKTETAQRLRARIARILDHSGELTGENPASLKAVMRRLPPLKRKVERVRHHPALPYDEMPTFMAKLRAIEGVPARVLEFLILTAARSTEALGVQWPEIDFEHQLWTVPKERMKAGVAHVVPLSPRALALLQQQFNARASSPFVFPGFVDNRPLDRETMRKVLRQLGLSAEQAGLHGFRSTFRDWAEDRTPFYREAEIALAHTVGSPTERAYRRGNSLDKRRELMTAWSNYCELEPGSVTWLNATGARP